MFTRTVLKKIAIELRTKTTYQLNEMLQIQKDLLKNKKSCNLDTSSTKQKIKLLENELKQRENRQNASI